MINRQVLATTTFSLILVGAACAEPAATGAPAAGASASAGADAGADQGLVEIVVTAQRREESSQRAVRSWLKLTTSQKATVDLIGAQDDSMAVGARKAFEELPNEVDRERFLKLPFTGCDGLPKTGQAWVRSGLLAATVFVPPNTGQAIEMFVQAIQQKKRPPERVLTVPTSIPQLSALKPLRMT